MVKRLLPVTGNGAQEGDPVNPVLFLFFIHLKLLCGSEAELRSEMGAEFRLGSGESQGLLFEFVFMLFSISACIGNVIS